MRNSKKIIATLFVAVVHIVCIQAAEKTPAWVNDYNSVYPESEWLAVVESAKNKQTAETNATASLSRMFKVDVQAVSSAAQSFSQTMNNGHSELSKNSSMSQQIDATSSVSGLMGVKIDSWKAKDGTFYACARMNRKEAAVTYSTIIKENDKVIVGLERDAASKRGTFDAFEYLTIAGDLAVLTDGYLDILSVINQEARSLLKLSYGNANSVKKLALENNQAIIIFIQIDNDEGGRIQKAFQQLFTSRGFRTSESSVKNAYSLSVNFSIESIQSSGADKYARYELNTTLSDNSGIEILAFSSNGRSGSTSYSEAEQRALRKAEAAINDIEDEESFSSLFEDYLSSLLK